MGLHIRYAMRILIFLKNNFLVTDQTSNKEILTGNREALLLVQTHIY